MLKKILLKNFKSYRDQVLPLAPLTLMIGANASGKSNVLEAFRFLSWLVEGQKLSVLQHTINDSNKILRGRIKDLGYLDNKQFTLGCVIDGASEWDKFEITLAGLIMQSSLGDLVTRGIVDRFIKHPMTSKERKENALNWLETLEGDKNE